MFRGIFSSTIWGNDGESMQKMDILGVTLTDYSLKESLLLLDGFLENGALNTILYVTTPMLILAGKDENEKERIESMDMTLCGESDILRVAKIESKSRSYEVENLVFLKEFLRRIVRGGKTIYLLSDSEEDAQKLRDELKDFQRGISVRGYQIIKEDAENVEEVVNDINDIAPSVIISRMAGSRQEQWMLEAKPYINAEVWLGISKDMKLGERRESFQKKAMSRIYKKMFHDRMNRYNGENEKNQ